jgi:hypothetical protein
MKFYQYILGLMYTFILTKDSYSVNTLKAYLTRFTALDRSMPSVFTKKSSWLCKITDKSRQTLSKNLIEPVCFWVGIGLCIESVVVSSGLIDWQREKQRR